MSIIYQRHAEYPDSILIRTFEGTVNCEQIIASWDYLISESLIHQSTVGIVNDLTRCELEMDTCSFPKLINYLKAHEELARLRLAVISDDPRIVVFPTLAEMNEDSLNIKPFSTNNAAVHWILNQ